MSTPPPAKRARTNEETAASTMDLIRSAIERVQAADDGHFIRGDGISHSVANDLLAKLAGALGNLMETDHFLPPVAPTPPRHTSDRSLVAKLHPNLTPFWIAALQEIEAKDLELIKTVMKDIEAGMPKLDELGILLRPHYGNGKIEPLVWEAALPGRAGTEWEGSLIKGTLTFPADYPKTHAKFKTVPPLFHPNVYPSGTMLPVFRDGSVSLDWPEDGLQNETPGVKSGFDQLFTTLPCDLRIPLLLHACRLSIHFPRFDAPRQLEAYTLARDMPAVYKLRQQEEAEARSPSPQDMLDAEEAQERAEKRKNEARAQLS